MKTRRKNKLRCNAVPEPCVQLCIGRKFRSSTRHYNLTDHIFHFLPFPFFTFHFYILQYLANIITEVSERCVENLNLRTPAEIRDFGRSMHDKALTVISRRWFTLLAKPFFRLLDFGIHKKYSAFKVGGKVGVLRDDTKICCVADYRLREWP